LKPAKHIILVRNVIKLPIMAETDDVGKFSYQIQDIIIFADTLKKDLSKLFQLSQVKIKLILSKILLLEL
jgi:hypothetical protein